MGSHPANLALRFLLELTALFALGLWGWRVGSGPVRWLLVLALPIVAATAWGTLAVPDDPSRSGGAPVPVAGPVRLALELSFFAAAVLCLWNLGWEGWATALGLVVVLHYSASYDRVRWLLQQ